MRAWRRERKTLRLEVNHIAPCIGAHGQLSCAHHLANLETLCIACHRATTATQFREAVSSAALAGADSRSRIRGRLRG
jgi:hypothetical protein